GRRCTSDFFFSSRRRHTRSKRDWSSDVCSSDLGEPELLRCDAQVRRDIIWTNGLKQDQVRTLLEELSAPATVRAKKQALLTIDHASIQVRNSHWWCAHRSFAVNLSVVLFYQVLVGRAQP